MNIFESIVAVQADVEFIGKDKQVQSGGTYKYRGVDQVLNTLHPLFARHKVFAVPEVLELLFREHRTTQKGGEVVYQALKVKYTFYAEDGTNVSAVVVGEAMDSGDKASNKCMSIAYKYACFQILSIPTEETTADPDDDNQALASQNEQHGNKSAQTKWAQVNDLIKDTSIEMSQVQDLIVTKFGANIKINDLSDEQFATLIWVLKKNIGYLNE